MRQYIKRTLGRWIEEGSRDFKVILLMGPRQVGKTRLLKEMAQEGRSYVTLGDQNMRIAARRDPGMFLDRLELPVLIDEVQYAPELFSYIKMRVDEGEERGVFWLAGSQEFEKMEDVREMMGERMGVFRLQGLSLEEEEGGEMDGAFLPRVEVLKERKASGRKGLGVKEIYEKIWRGSFPEVVSDGGGEWELFYESYVSTYIQNDIRERLRVGDEGVFRRFMEVVAGRTGRMVNYHEISKDVGVSEPTVKKWLRVLEDFGTVYLLEGYQNERSKRLIKTAKVYFMDTGLCSYLSGWLSVEVLERGAMSGAILETYVVSEIIKSYLHRGRVARMYFYKDKERREIDIVIEEEGVLYPIEIRKTSRVVDGDFEGFSALGELGVKVGHGAVVCFVKDLVAIGEGVEGVPVSFI